MDQTWVPNGRKRLPSLVDSSDSEADEITDLHDPSKKMRVGTASVHKEYEQTKGDNGKFKSVCKHCQTIYNHRNCTGLMAHLRTKHPSIHQKCHEEDNKIREGRVKQKKAAVQIVRGETSKGHKPISQALFGEKKNGGPMDNFLQKPLPKHKQDSIEDKFVF